MRHFLLDKNVKINNTKLELIYIFHNENMNNPEKKDQPYYMYYTIYHI